MTRAAVLAESRACATWHCIGCFRHTWLNGGPMWSNWEFKGWKLCATAVASFALGSLITAHLTHVQEVKADSNRVFELMVYHTEPGKVPALESIFKDVSKLQA